MGYYLVCAKANHPVKGTFWSNEKEWTNEPFLYEENPWDTFIQGHNPRSGRNGNWIRVIRSKHLGAILAEVSVTKKDIVTVIDKRGYDFWEKK